MKLREFAPPTCREAEELALAHEGVSFEQLAAGLPEHAFVADIGAGGSRFGVNIAALRPDISWINVDPRYESSAPFADEVARQLAEVPLLPNVRYIAAKAESLRGFRKASLDRIYCSAVMPHLILDSPRIAERAVHRMARLLKPEGYVSLHTWARRQNAVRISGKEYQEDPEHAARRAVEAMRLSPEAHATQYFQNLTFYNIHLMRAHREQIRAAAALSVQDCGASS